MQALITALFFFSGATSLVYETLWIRVLSLAVGSTSAAMSLVLALFFLGLSVGSWLSARWLTHYARPLRLYAILEGVIGIVCLPLIYALLNFHHILSLLPLEGSFSWMGTFTKFVLVAIAISVPTLAMGATLPLIVRLFSVMPESALGGRSVSLLYAVNTFGAVFGTLLASFVLIPQLGLVLTNHVTAAVNVLLFAAAWWVDAKYVGPVTAPTLAEKSDGPLTLDRYQKGLIAVSALCGFSSLASQVVWNKYLGIFIGNNIYGLGLVLSLYLMGIALGSLLLYGLLPRLRRPDLFFWAMLLLLPVSIAFTSYLFNWVPFAASVAGYYLPWNLTLIKCLLCSFLLLPFTSLLGALFPMTVHLIAPAEKEAHRAVGVAYAVNTVGAILGSCLAGLVLIPQFGSSLTIKIASALVALAALWLARIGHPVHEAGAKKGKTREVLALASLAIVVLLGNLDFRNIIKSAYVQQIDHGSTLTQALRYFSKDYEDFKWIREGETSVITLSQDPKDGDSYRDYLRLKTNGLNESIYYLRRLEELPRYEAMLGLLPYLFLEKPRNAFVVGYGGGYTVDLMTQLPIEKVHVVELEQAILEAADTVYKGKNPVIARPNLDLAVEDARFVLAAKLKAPLDIIVSQPSHSWLAGAANLFTLEFFKVVKENLSDRGIFSQWLNLYNMDVETLKSLLYTFYEVFPHGAVFSGQGDQEMILLGSKQPLRFNGAEATRLSQDPTFRHNLIRVPLNSPTDILAHFALSRERIRDISKGAKLNTDVNAYAETRQSRTFYSGVAQEELPQAFLLENYRWGFTRLLEGTHDWTASVLQSLQNTGQNDKFLAYLKVFEEQHKNDPSRHAQLGHFCLKAQRYDSARRYLESAFSRQRNSDNFNALVFSHLEVKEEAEALKLIAAHPRLHDKVTDCYSLTARLGLGRTDGVKSLAQRMSQDVPSYTQACGDYFNRLMGHYFYSVGEYAAALPFYEAYHAVYTHDTSALKRMSVSYLKVQDWTNAARATQELEEQKAHEKTTTTALMTYYQRQELQPDAQALLQKMNRQSLETIAPRTNR